MISKTDFLFATPSAISGVARLLDFAGVYDSYNSSASEQEADCKAAIVDWSTVGRGIVSSLVDACAEDQSK